MYPSVLLHHALLSRERWFSTAKCWSDLVVSLEHLEIPMNGTQGVTHSLHFVTGLVNSVYSCPHASPAGDMQLHVVPT